MNVRQSHDCLIFITGISIIKIRQSHNCHIFMKETIYPGLILGLRPTNERRCYKKLAGRKPRISPAHLERWSLYWNGHQKTTCEDQMAHHCRFVVVTKVSPGQLRRRSFNLLPPPEGSFSFSIDFRRNKRLRRDDDDDEGDGDEAWFCELGNECRLEDMVHCGKSQNSQRLAHTSQLERRYVHVFTSEKQGLAFC